MDRGDVFHVDLDPIAGHEQAGRRFVLVLSPGAFNDRFGTPLVCPITQGGGFVRRSGFAVSLAGTGTRTRGVVLCNQPRVLDLKARHARFIERLPDAVVGEVLARLRTLLD